MKKINWDEDWYYLRNGKMSAIHLPHDAMMEQGRLPDAQSGNSGAYYEGGEYIYTKIFELDEEQLEKSYQVQFDGIYQNWEIYVNDKFAAKCIYGYVPVLVDLDGMLQAGVNKICVKAKNKEQPNSRWYSGGGIYRSVWLWEGNKTHILPFGIKISTVSISPAEISVDVEHSGGEVMVEIWDGSKQIVSTIGDHFTIKVPEAKLWSHKDPYLYECHALVKKDGIVVDQAVRKFGIRTLNWDTTGFYVNEKRTMLQGGCIHHDNGILGACSFTESEKRRLRIMKDCGFNAIRCSHNPASTALLEACDEIGIYVVEEMWDMWYQSKNKYDYSSRFMAHWKEDVHRVVDRDYSHPCVIMYSIGNEVTEPHEEKGIELGKEIQSKLKELDHTRPVTIGLNMALVAMAAMGIGVSEQINGDVTKTPPAVNSTVFNETISKNDRLVMASCKEEVDRLCSPILDAMDIAGYNYGAPRYPLDAVSHPNRIVLGTETFPHQLAETWRNLEKMPYVIGDFMWTAWDYIGECSIGTWAHTKDGLCFAKSYPWKLADAGAFDLIGNPTGEALWAAAVWKGTTSIGVRPVMYPTDTLARGAWRGTNAIPSWSFRGCDGKEAMVEVYTPETKVSLFLNGKLIEEKQTQDMRAIFVLAYHPGKLEAVVYDENGIEKNSVFLISSENPSWTIKRERLQGKADQIAFYHFSLEDKNGTVESNADEILSIQVDGGELLGFGSGIPRTVEEFHTGTYPTQYGHALAAVRIIDEQKLSVRIVERAPMDDEE